MGGYLLSEGAANYLRRAMGDPRPPLAGGRQYAAAPPKLMAWVRVTGGSSPWWTGVVEQPLNDGTWESLAGTVEVMTAAGPLKAGTAHRYLCQRTGDKADGTPRFVAVMPKLVARTVVTAVDFATCTVTTDVGYFVDA